MATFNVIVDGTTVEPLLYGPDESVNSCISVYDFKIGASNGDSITLDFTPTVAYTDYSCQLRSTGSFSVISNSSHTFVHTGVTHTLRVILENDGTTNTNQVTIDATNNTTAGTDQAIVSRTSTGATC